MLIPEHVLRILAASHLDGSTLQLPEQLERKLYLQVDKVLKAAGGRWDTKSSKHLFDGPVRPLIAAMLDTGEIIRPQDHGYFPSPPAVADLVVDWADIIDGTTVLEPSAGTGALARAAADLGGLVHCIELLPKLAGTIEQDGYAASVTVADFLEVPATRFYDRVVMNPPFANGTDVAHVLHALDFLAPGGLLVAVMAAGIEFRRDRDHHKLRFLINARGGDLYRLPEESFKTSGTGVQTVLVAIPAADMPV